MRAAGVLHKENIIETLAGLGISNGDTIFVHSSLKSAGCIQGGANTLIAAFMEILGSEGTLAMPAFSDNVTEPFDPDSTPSDTGAVTEIFRKKEGVLRSLHPTHSVCACGKNAEYIVRGHESCETACGPKSPFQKMRQLKGKIVLLGVDMNRNTMLHAIEEEAQVPYLLDSFRVPVPVYLSKTGDSCFEIRKFPAGHRDFLKITPLLRENELLEEGVLGDAQVKVMDVDSLFSFTSDILKMDASFFLCNNSCCNSCLAGRRKADPDFAVKPDAANSCTVPNCEICVV